MSEERYPGMKALANRLFKECPRGKHGELSRQMKFYLEVAKSMGIAASMDWNSHNIHTLKKQFGSPPSLDTISLPKTGPTSTNTTKGINQTRQGLNMMEYYGYNNGMAMNVIPSPLPMSRKTPSLPDPNDPWVIDTKPMTKSVLMSKGTHHSLNGVTSSGTSNNGAQVSKKNGKRQIPIPVKSASMTRQDRLSTQKFAADLRSERFSSSVSKTPAPYRNSQILETIVGTSTELEKPYFRLTGQVNPAVVRPPEVLILAFSHVLQKYSEGKGYTYITSQLQSIRQDLTVQHIETDLTVVVYEVNARIALFHDDLGEFNKCLTRVSDLYKGHPELRGNRSEFKAYGLYYMILRRKWDEISLALQQEDTDRIFTPGADLDSEAKPRPSNTSSYGGPEKLSPASEKEQVAMLERAYMAIHHVQQQDLLSLTANWRAAWFIETKLLAKILQREQAMALEGILSSTKAQNQIITLESIGAIVGGLQTNEVQALLKSWNVSYDNQGVNSVQALPILQRNTGELKGFDLKGQI